MRSWGWIRKVQLTRDMFVRQVGRVQLSWLVLCQPDTQTRVIWKKGISTEKTREIPFSIFPFLLGPWLHDMGWPEPLPRMCVLHERFFSESLDTLVHYERLCSNQDWASFGFYWNRSHPYSLWKLPHCHCPFPQLLYEWPASPLHHAGPEHYLYLINHTKNAYSTLLLYSQLDKLNWKKKHLSNKRLLYWVAQKTLNWQTNKKPNKQTATKTRTDHDVILSWLGYSPIVGLSFALPDKQGSN